MTNFIHIRSNLSFFNNVKFFFWFSYGSVREIWFDGAKGTNAPNISYYFSDWFYMVKELQSSINIFSDAGPDVRWVGNEKGFAGSTCWSTVNRTSLSIGNASIEK